MLAAVADPGGGGRWAAAKVARAPVRFSKYRFLHLFLCVFPKKSAIAIIVGTWHIHRTEILAESKCCPIKWRMTVSSSNEIQLCDDISSTGG